MEERALLRREAITKGTGVNGEIMKNWMDVRGDRRGTGGARGCKRQTREEGWGERAGGREAVSMVTCRYVERGTRVQEQSGRWEGETEMESPLVL